MRFDLEDESLFPEKFPDDSLIGKTFLWVYNNRREFVDFTLKEMIDPTGFFKTWQTYCIRKSEFA